MGQLSSMLSAAHFKVYGADKDNRALNCHLWGRTSLKSLYINLKLWEIMSFQVDLSAILTCVI